MDRLLWLSFWGCLLSYACCSIFAGVRAAFGRDAKRWEMGFLWLAASLHGIHYLARWAAQGQPPMVRQADLFVLLSWAGVLMYLFVGRTIAPRSVTGLVSLAALFLLSWQSMEAKEVRPLVPALRSAWLTIHVLFCMVSYAALATGSLTCGWILLRRTPAPSQPGSDLDAFAERMIRIGYCFLTLGIVTGSIWAQRAWGRYWGWDPKETASLVTWLVYLAYLHMPKGLSRRGAAMMAVAGLLSVAFTWFGVALLPGLHSYQG